MSSNIIEHCRLAKTCREELNNKKHCLYIPKLCLDLGNGGTKISKSPWYRPEAAAIYMECGKLVTEEYELNLRPGRNERMKTIEDGKTRDEVEFKFTCMVHQK